MLWIVITEAKGLTKNQQGAGSAGAGISMTKKEEKSTFANTLGWQPVVQEFEKLKD